MGLEMEFASKVVLEHLSKKVSPPLFLLVPDGGGSEVPAGVVNTVYPRSKFDGLGWDIEGKGIFIQTLGENPPSGDYSFVVFWGGRTPSPDDLECVRKWEKKGTRASIS